MLVCVHEHFIDKGVNQDLKKSYISFILRQGAEKTG